jgi:hypothetical protein
MLSSHGFFESKKKRKEEEKEGSFLSLVWTRGESIITIMLLRIPSFNRNAL